MTSTAGSPPASLYIRCGNWFFRHRNWAFPVALIALLIVPPPRLLAGDLRWDRWLDLAGVLVALGGSGLRAWVIGLAYIKRGGVDKKVYAETLVTSGLFGVCRNPLYVGNALVLIGLFIIHNNPLVYVLGGAYFGFAYWCIVAAEEAYLSREFGDEFDAYCTTVPRFWLNWSRYAAATAGMTFNWRRVAAKDYSSIYSWVIAAILLHQYGRFVAGSRDVLAIDWLSSIAGLLVATLLLGVVKFLKTRRLLRAD